MGEEKLSLHPLQLTLWSLGIKLDQQEERHTDVFILKFSLHQKEVHARKVVRSESLYAILIGERVENKEQDWANR